MLGDRTIIFEKGQIKRDFYKRDLLSNFEYLKDFEFPGIISIISSLHSQGININLEDLSIPELTEKLIKKELKK